MSKYLTKNKLKIVASLILDFLVIPIYFIISIIKGLWSGLEEFTRDIKYTSYHWKCKLDKLKE